MDTRLETVTDLERRLDISIPAAPLERELDARLRARNLRTGQQTGQPTGDAIRERMINGVMHAMFLEAVSQHNLASIGTPRFSNPDLRDDALYYGVDFAISPDLDMTSFTDIVISKPEPVYSDSDVDDFIGWLQRNSHPGKDLQRSEVILQLDKKLARAVRNVIRPQLLQGLQNKYPFTPPPVMVETELGMRMQKWQARKTANPTTQIPPVEKVRHNSSLAVRMEIILLCLVKTAGIGSDDDEIREEVEHAGQQQTIMNDELLLAQADWAVKANKAIDWVADQATVSSDKSGCRQLLPEIFN